jgi:peptidoglycan hydrolase CwlO-like protein
MDLGTIGLLVSIVVAMVQIFTFFDNRAVRKEQSLNTFAKADIVKSELTDIRTTIEAKLSHLSALIQEVCQKFDSIDEEIGANSTDIAVIKERISNDREFAKKLEEKLDKILDKI